MKLRTDNMSKFLEVGKYYYGLFDDADIGEHELPFFC